MADRVHELKETEKGVEHMCKEMEALRLEGVEEGRAEEKKAVAYSLADRKMSAEEIAGNHQGQHRNRQGMACRKCVCRKIENYFDRFTVLWLCGLSARRAF